MVQIQWFLIILLHQLIRILTILFHVDKPMLNLTIPYTIMPLKSQLQHQTPATNQRMVSRLFILRVALRHLLNLIQTPPNDAVCQGTTLAAIDTTIPGSNISNGECTDYYRKFWQITAPDGSILTSTTSGCIRC